MKYKEYVLIQSDGGALDGDMDLGPHWFRYGTKWLSEPMVTYNQ